MDPLSFAKQFATLHHVVRKGQMYGVVPYTHHLAEVERRLTNHYNIWDLDERIAAWLHDIVEDTDVKLRDVEENFGEEVARLVGAVTSEPGENRKIRNALTYPKIKKAGPKAIRLKLADRLANMSSGGSSLKMYVREYPDFRESLFIGPESPLFDTTNECMWRDLDRIAEFNK